MRTTGGRYCWRLRLRKSRTDLTNLAHIETWPHEPSRCQDRVRRICRTSSHSSGSGQADPQICSSTPSRGRASGGWDLCSWPQGGGHTFPNAIFSPSSPPESVFLPETETSPALSHPLYPGTRLCQPRETAPGCPKGPWTDPASDPLVASVLLMGCICKN